MQCSKCKSKLLYGAQYCNKCGDAIPKEAFEEEYNHSLWAKLDKVKDEYDSFFFKKITGSAVFKTISLIVVLGYFFFTMYGNLTGIRLKENVDYAIEYNNKFDEYYIELKKDSANLEMFVPFGTDKIVFTGNAGDKTEKKEYSVEEYEKTGYEIKENTYDYVTVETLIKNRKSDSVKFIVVSK